MTINEIEQKSINANNGLKSWKTDIANEITKKGSNISPTGTKKEFITAISNISGGSGGGYQPGDSIPIDKIIPPGPMLNVDCSHNSYKCFSSFKIGDSLYVSGENYGNNISKFTPNSEVVRMDLSSEHRGIEKLNDGFILVMDGYITKVNLDLSEAWKTTVDNNVYGRKIIINNGFVYIASCDNNGYADSKVLKLNLNTGELLKTYVIDDTCLMGLFVNDTHVIARSGSKITILNLNLELVKQYSNLDPTTNLGNPLTYFICEYSHFYIIDKQTSAYLIDKNNLEQEPTEIMQDLWNCQYIIQTAPDKLFAMMNSGSTYNRLFTLSDTNGFNASHINLPLNIVLTNINKVSDGYIAEYGNNGIIKLDNEFNELWRLDNFESQSDCNTNNAFVINMGLETIIEDDENYWCVRKGKIQKFAKVPSYIVK